jgi:predicted solute-binding protein
VSEAEERFYAKMAEHRKGTIDGVVAELERLERRIERYVDERIDELTRRVDEVHERALRELTRLHERR